MKASHQKIKIHANNNRGIHLLHIAFLKITSSLIYNEFLTYQYPISISYIYKHSRNLGLTSLLFFYFFKKSIT